MLLRPLIADGYVKTFCVSGGMAVWVIDLHERHTGATRTGGNKVQKGMRMQSRRNLVLATSALATAGITARARR